MLRTLVRGRVSNNTGLGLSLGIGLGLVISCSSVPPKCKSGEVRSEAGDGSGGSSVDTESKPSLGSHEDEPTFREDVIGSYEDRIRNFSSAERVFEFFASVTNDKGTFMTPRDFARAMTPYQHRSGVKLGSDNFKFNFQAKNNQPTRQERARYKAVLQKILEDDRVTPAEVKEMIAARKKYNIAENVHRKALKDLGVTQAQLDELAAARGGIAKRRFWAMVDVDGDGLISYEEFMLFRTLIAIPKRKLAIAFRMFDRDDSGTIDWFEFEAFMNVLKRQTNVGRTEVERQHRSDAQVASRLFFADDRDGEKLTMEKFSTFVQILQQEALVMQFHQWDRRGDGTLSATDFAKFLATKITSDRALYKEYLERAKSEKIAQLKADISLEEFLAFHELLEHLPEMEVAMKVSGTVEGRGLNRQQFVHAAKAALQGGRLRQEARERVVPDAMGDLKDKDVLSPGVLETLFVLLDTNNNGLLEQDEFMKLMERQAPIPDPPRSLGVLSFLSRVKDCAEQALF